MFVYLIRDGENSLYKIGVTHDLKSRLKQLNGNQSPNEKHIVFYIEVINAEPTEAILHNKYKKYNHRGEWFRLNNKQVENVMQDMDLMKNNEQILYSNNHEEEDNDDRVLELLAQIESLDLDVVELLELVERLSAIALRKLAEEKEDSNSDDDEEYEDEDDEDQE